MATDIATLAIKVDSTDTERAEKSLKKMNKTGEATEDRFSSMTNTIKSTAMAAAAFAAVAGGVLATGISKSIALASDLEETQNKFNVVFRGMTEDAEKWSKTLVKSYQMSNEESKRYLSSLQDLLVPTGIAREEAGKMANEFTKLAADLGSFNNLPTATVVRDIQSALAGGSETMTKYGIDIKVATVKAEAYALGLAKQGEQLSKAARAQAVLSLALKHSSDAVGDSIRSSGSYALQMKELRAKINDVSTVIGAKFLPKVTEIITKINDWIDNNQKLIDQQIDVWAKRIADGLMFLGEAIKFIADNKEIIALFVGVHVILPKVIAVTKLSVIAFKSLGTGIASLAAGFPVATIAMTAFIAAFKIGEWIRLRDVMRQTAEAQEQIAWGQKAAIPMLKEISDRTGVAVTSLDEFNEATRNNTLVYDENLKLWVKGLSIKEESIQIEKKAAEQTEDLSKKVDSLGVSYNKASAELLKFNGLQRQSNGVSVSIGGKDARWDPDANDGAGDWVTTPSQTGSGKPGNSSTITNYFNTQLNSNDIVNITTEQERQGARS
jgi:hypothetical protein